MIQRIYTFFAALLVRALVKYCTARGRYVDYVHATGEHSVKVGIDPAFPGAMVALENSTPIERVYMRRYVITGFMTGDKHPNSLVTRTGWRSLFQRVLRQFALNRWHLYLHHMHAPDADECLHDHPWPWGLSFILLGGYTEQRNLDEPPKYAGTIGTRSLQAPALNRLRGTTFHRISELKKHDCRFASPRGRMLVCKQADCCANSRGGVFTLFLAGPRSASKPWGYLVPGRGFVPQRERHAETGAREERAQP